LLLEGATKLEALIVEGTWEEDQTPVAAQVKEKFGTLRFYMYWETPEMRCIIDEMENKSARTCEVCGGVGRTRGGGWVHTTCDTCEEKRHG